MIYTVRTTNTSRTFVAEGEVWMRLITELERIADTMPRNDRMAMATMAATIRGQVMPGKTQVTVDLDTADRMLNAIDRHRIDV